MKTIIIYFSYDGNCDMVAKQLQAPLNADLLRLYLEDDTCRKGFAKYLWGGGQALGNKAPALKPYAADLAGYDLVVIGAPVWAGSPAPALRSFFENTAFSGKKAALFCCHAGGKGKALEKLRQRVAGNDVIGETDFVNPAKQDPRGVREKAEAWARDLASRFPAAPAGLS
ncbi:MAG: NAD(P)H-dependent oxidoreductase [Spirochaetaceae bacterium]|jgi:flavodoxin|nr:NAD(P)H-dependent oxidoreductase [Spirochaetaceae bacterium]